MTYEFPDGAQILACDKSLSSFANRLDDRR